MVTIDIVLGVILLIAGYLGFKKGLFVTLASLIGLVAGVYGAIYFSHYAADFLTQRFNWSTQTKQCHVLTFVQKGMQRNSRNYLMWCCHAA